MPHGRVGVEMGAMGQGNDREGYGEVASEKDLEYGAMASVD